MVCEKFNQRASVPLCKVRLFPGSTHQASQPYAQLQIHHKLFVKAQKLLTVNTCFILDKHSVQKSMQNPSAARVCVSELRSISKILLALLSCHGNQFQWLCT